MSPASLQRRWGDPWIVATGADNFWSQLAAFQAQLQAANPENVLLADPDPVRFLAAFFAAVQHPCRVWLANPHWGKREWEQLAAQCQPDFVVGIVPQVMAAGERMPTAHCPPPTGAPAQILVATGGSSGNLRFATHTWHTLTASVQGFCQHFGCDRVNAYCVLPLYHVSGLMQAMRCLLSGGQLVIQPFQELLQGGALAPPLSAESAPSCPTGFLSLVPTQLQRLLEADWDTVPWLRSFAAILLGGAPPWPSLLQTARDRLLPLAPTYGMTETASQVATLLPQEFLAGQTGSGRPLPHAHLTICDAEGNALPPGETGQLAIAASSLAIAVGERAIVAPFQTGDLGYLDESGCLHVVGRESALIITGGEKVLPQEVEAAILATGLVRDVAVLGMADGDWGERVVAVVAPGTACEFRLEEICRVLKPQLSPYKLPKQWLICSTLPRNAQGKLNQSVLRQWVMAQPDSTAATTGLALVSGGGAAG